ncbi:uncharacterized protein [Physcomitrium patens]|uniref:Uncharacterized protein n=1 Tax=Physcomitrium patens TaxID=3218 RepID=A0A2K1IR60_PHYPA|nr:hypothetical protein PHYPA_025889 [Physcomitrium patens]
MRRAMDVPIPTIPFSKVFNVSSCFRICLSCKTSNGVVVVEEREELALRQPTKRSNAMHEWVGGDCNTSPIVCSWFGRQENYAASPTTSSMLTMVKSRLRIGYKLCTYGCSGLVHLLVLNFSFL